MRARRRDGVVSSRVTNAVAVGDEAALKRRTYVVPAAGLAIGNCFERTVSAPHGAFSAPRRSVRSVTVRPAALRRATCR